MRILGGVCSIVSHARIESERRRVFEESVQAFRDDLAHTDTPCSVQVVFAFSPAARILATVEDRAIDLVALTTHGRSGPSRWLYGSVAEHVVRECRAPLLVVRPSG